MTTTNPGAPPGAWQYLQAQGLGPYLLPVASDLNAPISAGSKLKERGKVPSNYNREGEIHGIRDWTEHRSTPEEIERWARNPRLGICLQTGHGVYAVDIDVPEREKSAPIVALLRKMVPNGNDLPIRTRPNSGKCLLFFNMPPGMPKRRMGVEGGVVEILGLGQQFIMAGTHPSQVKYEVSPAEPPFIDVPVEAFESFWSTLGMLYGTGDAVTGTAVARRRDADLDIHDDQLEYLLEHRENYGFDGNGALMLPCPFKDQHTSDSGETETVYFPAGTNGYQRGHWKCLHAHCMNKTDGDFMIATGYSTRLMTCLPATIDPRQKPSREQPPFLRAPKSGKILATITQVQAATMTKSMVGDIAYDIFKDDILIAQPGAADWESLQDEDYTRLRITLEELDFQPIGREMIRDAVGETARKNKFDSAQLWLNDLVWDGEPRISSFYAKYFGCVPSEYVSAVGDYTWTALAARIISPGCQADMAPILVGAQGLGKSTGIKAIVPSPEFYAEMSFSEDKDNKSRKMRGRMVIEFAELQGLQSREQEEIKAFITQTQEDWTPKFKERNFTFHRRCLFFGTTNQEEFLSDPTGNRRWLPLSVTKVDVEGIARDRDQLWAEGAWKYRLSGISYEAAERLAAGEHHKYAVRDVWTDSVLNWVDLPDSVDGMTTPRSRGTATLNEILSNSVGLRPSQITHQHQLRMGKALKALGWTKRQLSDGRGSRVWTYVIPPISK